jgi:hypothetical protein
MNSKMNKFNNVYNKIISEAKAFCKNVMCEDINEYANKYDVSTEQLEIFSKSALITKEFERFSQKVLDKNTKNDILAKVYKKSIEDFQNNVGNSNFRILDCDESPAWLGWAYTIKLFDVDVNKDIFTFEKKSAKEHPIEPETRALSLSLSEDSFKYLKNELKSFVSKQRDLDKEEYFRLKKTKPQLKEKLKLPENEELINQFKDEFLAFCRGEIFEISENTKEKWNSLDDEQKDIVKFYLRQLDPDPNYAYADGPAYFKADDERKKFLFNAERLISKLK